MTTNVSSPQILHDNVEEIKLLDSRSVLYNSVKRSNESHEEIPNKITGSYSDDFNILYVDQIIRKKLHYECTNYLLELKAKYNNLRFLVSQPQTYIMRKDTLESLDKIDKEIKEIESGKKLYSYDLEVRDIIHQYKKISKPIKTVLFDNYDIELKEHEDIVRQKLILIDKFLELASKYIQIDVVKVSYKPKNICLNCGMLLDHVSPNEDGTIRCPECYVDYNSITFSKTNKDSIRVTNNNNTEDESIDNFLRAFIRYQGLQPERPDESLYKELDEYFKRNNRPTGDEIKKLPLNNRGRRGDTNHKMLWTALAQIGRSEYYEDVNLIGYIYWGWKLPNVMHLKDRIIDKYIKTQRVFYQIPPEERGRSSSLGTQYRLWRHLQLEGHECYMDEFKIAENPESLRMHNRLWKLMCEGANDPEIYYIP